MVGSIDGGAHLLQQHARTVLLGAAVFMVPMVALNLFLSVLAFNDFSSLDGLFADRGYIGVENTSVFLAIVVESFTAHLIGAYAAVFLVRYQMGGQPTIREGVVAVLRRSPWLVLTWVLTHWWAVVVALGVVNAPTVAAGAIAFVLPVIALFTALVLVVVPVLMTEGTGARSLGRAVRLVRTRFGAAYGFVLACGLIGGLLFLFISELPYLAESTGLITFGSFGYLVQGVASQLALLVVVPFSALATAQFYVQLRVHAEGIDISMAADRAFGRRR